MTTQKKIILSFAVVALLAAGCNQVTRGSVTSTTTSSSTPPGSSPSSQYAMSEVKLANSAAKCWTVINGSVYDLTNWIHQHPGGAQAILSLCGKDGTKSFMAQHGGQGRPEQELATLKIGTLK